MGTRLRLRGWEKSHPRRRAASALYNHTAEGGTGAKPPIGIWGFCGGPGAQRPGKGF